MTYMNAHRYDLTCGCEDCKHFQGVLAMKHFEAQQRRLALGRQTYKLGTTTYRRPSIMRYILDSHEDAKERVLDMIAKAQGASAQTRRQWQKALEMRGWA